MPLERRLGLGAPPGGFLCDDLAAEKDTLVANAGGRPREQGAHLALSFAAERARRVRGVCAAHSMVSGRSAARSRRGLPGRWSTPIERLLDDASEPLEKVEIRIDQVRFVAVDVPPLLEGIANQFEAGTEAALSGPRFPQRCATGGPSRGRGTACSSRAPAEPCRPRRVRTPRARARASERGKAPPPRGDTRKERAGTPCATEAQWRTPSWTRHGRVRLVPPPRPASSPSWREAYQEHRQRASCRLVTELRAAPDRNPRGPGASAERMRDQSP